MRSYSYVALMAHRRRAHLPSPPRSPPDFSSEVVTASVGLLVWAILATFPHVEPFHPNLLLYLTLTTWWAPAWVLAITCAVLLLGLVVVSCCGVARLARALAAERLRCQPVEVSGAA